MTSQDISKLHTRKVKGLKRSHDSSHDPSHDNDEPMKKKLLVNL